MADPALPPRLMLLFRALDGKGDVSFEDLYRRTFGTEPPEYVQRHLGPYITRLNRRLGGRKVRPGRAKRTYRLD